MKHYTLKPFQIESKHISQIHNIIEKVVSEKKDEYWKNYTDYSVYDQTMITISTINDEFISNHSELLLGIESPKRTSDPQTFTYTSKLGTTYTLKSAGEIYPNNSPDTPNKFVLYNKTGSFHNSANFDENSKNLATYLGFFFRLFTKFDYSNPSKDSTS